MLRHCRFIDDANLLIDTSHISGRHFVFYIDIANFRSINEIYGIEAADLLLAAIGKYLSQIPQVVLWERIFSDQFVFLVKFDEPHSLDTVLDVCTQYMNIFLDEQRKLYPNCAIYVSCGIYGMERNNVIFAVDAANQARKEAKLKGSLLPCAFTKEAVVEDSVIHALECKIMKAMDENRLSYYLQPKVHLKTGKIVGAEALVRIFDEDGTQLSPAAFMSILEENGTVIDLDMLVLQRVCADLAMRLETGALVVPISVNLSRLHIYDQNAADNLHEIVQRYHISPSLIEFELTETLLTKDITATKNLVNALRNYGYKVSIDDFGSGYTSITLWQELEVDTIKLDKKFLVMEEPYYSRNLSIVPNVINTSQRLGIDVICEGIEQEDQCEYLIGLGCHMGQGYYFDKPMAVDAFYQMYEQKNEYYSLPYLTKDASTQTNPTQTNDEEATSNIAKLSGKMHDYLSRKNILIALSCFFILLFAFAIVSEYQEKQINSMFVDSINSSLDSFVRANVAQSDSIIDDVIDSCNTFAVLVDNRNTLEFVNEYLLSLNSGHAINRAVYEFLHYDSVLERLNSAPQHMGGTNGEYDVLTKAVHGETAVSSIVYSNSTGQYQFYICMPVYIQDNLCGVIRAIVNATALVDTDAFQSPFGTVHAILLSNETGTILYSTEQEANAIGENLYEHISKHLALQLTPSELKMELIDSIDATSYLPSTIGADHFVAHRALTNVPWNCTVVFESTNTQAFSLALHKMARYSELLLGILLFIISLFLVQLFSKEKQKLALEQERYTLLEQFSDTILFDYNYSDDSIVFTENATKYFDLSAFSDNKMHGFLTHLDTTALFYPGDEHIIRQLLNGITIDDKSECRVRMKNTTGEYLWCLLQFKFIYQDTRLVSVVGKISNIDEQYQHEQALRNRAMRDSATLLYNKESTRELITNALPKDAVGAFLIIDIDNLKRINDEGGHMAGDIAIQTISNCLKQQFRSEDILGRIGGDEFIVYARNLNDRILIASRLDHLMELIHQNDDTLSVSIGVALFPQHGQDYDTLYMLADQAMYHAKHAGKNQYAFCELPPRK